MRVERVELSGIGPFEDAVFDFGPEPPGEGELVLFEGPNGSGKTTLMELVTSLVHGDGPNGSLARRFTASNGVATAVTSHAGQRYTAQRKPRVMASGAFGPHVPGSGGKNVWAAFGYNSHQQRPQLYTAGPRDVFIDPHSGGVFGGGASEGPPQEPLAKLIGQYISNLHFDLLQTDYEARQPDANATTLELRRHALELSRARYDDALSKMFGVSAKLVIPVGRRSPELELDGRIVPIDALSEGFASIFAWLADLLTRLHLIEWVDLLRSPLQQEFLLFLDEIDQPLHPNLQARILPTVRELFPRARIYASTHSPFVVASVTKGVIFPIRPGGDHLVRGQVERRPLGAGESLELVTSDIFEAPTGFVDAETKGRLAAHRDDIERVRSGDAIDWVAFLRRRDALFAQNDEVKTATAFEEVPIRDDVRKALERRSEAAE